MFIFLIIQFVYIWSHIVHALIGGRGQLAVTMLSTEQTEASCSLQADSQWSKEVIQASKLRASCSRADTSQLLSAGRQPAG
jgi:hypothetical protein